jgi:PPP family 3-phenylpropionic acid transporter
MASAGAEAIVMFLWRKVGATMTARTMLIIAGVVAAVRWTIMAFNPALPVLFALQLLHGITYPFSYFGLVHFIANWAPEEIAAEAQSFSWALAQIASVITLVAFGWLVGQIGGQTYFFSALLTALAAGAAWWSLILKPAHGHADATADAR